MNVTLKNIQYHPNGDPVACLITHPMGSFFVNTTQTALLARVVAPETTWGDAECLAEAQAGVDALYPDQGFTVVLPEES